MGEQFNHCLDPMPQGERRETERRLGAEQAGAIMFQNLVDCVRANE
jgi:hypothetical protein